MLLCAAHQRAAPMRGKRSGHHGDADEELKRQLGRLGAVHDGVVLVQRRPQPGAATPQREHASYSSFKGQPSAAQRSAAVRLWRRAVQAAAGHAPEGTQAEGQRHAGRGDGHRHAAALLQLGHIHLHRSSHHHQGRSECGRQQRSSSPEQPTAADHQQTAGDDMRTDTAQSRRAQPPNLSCRSCRAKRSRRGSGAGRSSVPPSRPQT